MTTMILQQKATGISLVKKVIAIISAMNLWIERYHQRKQLAELEPRMMRDLGLSKAQVQAEISKPFWK